MYAPDECCAQQAASSWCVTSWVSDPALGACNESRMQQTSCKHMLYSMPLWHTIHTGRLRLASTVQYMPLSVIGGYLGYVGFFICISGAGVSTGDAIQTVTLLLHMMSTSTIL